MKKIFLGYFLTMIFFFAFVNFVFADETYTVEYYANNGTTAHMIRTYKTDKYYIIPANKFTKSGYTLIGWSTSKNGDQKYIAHARFTNMTKANKTQKLYAV